jgi:hypothetical protein
MRYLNKGVPLTKEGFPVCYLDGVTCQVKLCAYFIRIEALGNCVLRVDKNDIFTLDDIGKVMHISRERVRQLEERTLAKILKWRSEELVGYLDEFSKSPPDDYPYPIRNHKVLGMLRGGRVRG